MSRRGPRKSIFLHKKGSPYHDFTNFSTLYVVHRGKTYPTCKHLFEAFKFIDEHPRIAESIRVCGERPIVALRAGSGYEGWVRSDWDQVKIQKMEIVLRLKLAQYPKLIKLLLRTGDANLILDFPGDYFWATGEDGSGRNEFGKALMRLRDELCQQPESQLCSAGKMGRSRPKVAFQNSCLVCWQPSNDSHFCSWSCTSEAQCNAPVLLAVPEYHRAFDSVSGQFKASWRHPTFCPPVRLIYKIIDDPSSNAKYEAYKKSVEARGNFVAAGWSPGNERRRWHGTTRVCLLGENGNVNLCTSTSCSLCGIIRTSYRLDLFGKKTGWGRFGRGIYTSATSSKSNDYSKNITKNSYLKAMILNKVVVGKAFKVTRNASTLTAPPQGHDSIVGEPSKQGDLNYDELVCYTENAIRPSYLVMYSDSHPRRYV